MHYRNGRQARNGDKILSLDCLEEPKIGILRDAIPGNDFCNGYVQVGTSPSKDDPIACMCDCLKWEDVVAILKEKGLDQRPA